MKSSITLLLIVAAVCCVLPFALGLDSGDGPNLPPEVGRYALESGEYLAPSHAAERRVPGIFKIDTATGKVWRYAGRIAGKERIEEWVAIPN